MHIQSALLLYGACALIVLPAMAQSNSIAPGAVQADARVPQVKYESAFENYAPYREQPLATWREVNDEVARVGGHLGMFGGHAGHGGSKPDANLPAGAPATSSKTAPAQPPERGAATAPQGRHTEH